MKSIKRGLAAITLTIFAAMLITGGAAMAAPAPDYSGGNNIANYFSNQQQVLLENVQAQVISVNQIAVNTAVNVAPVITVAPYIWVAPPALNLDFSAIGPKF